MYHNDYYKLNRNYKKTIRNSIRYSDICKLKYFKKVFGKNKLKKYLQIFCSE